MTEQLIDSLIELENAAAERFWITEDRSAWKEELLRFAESKNTIQLKPLLSESSKHTKSKPLMTIVALLDEELIRVFNHQGKKNNDRFEESSLSSKKDSNLHEPISGVFLSPGFWMYDNWHAIEQNLRSHLEWSRERGHLVFRNGFFNSSADILMAAELGFTGVQIHVHSMDLFELQMALELARDCRLCPIVSAANVEELELAIQTDAPHLGLCFFPEQSSHEQMQFVQQAITKIPKDCTRVLFGSIRSESELSYLSHLSFDCIFRFGD